MKRAWAVALALACCGGWAQAQAGGSSQTPQSSAGSGQSGAPNTPPSGSSAGGALKESNPFPENTNSVPVMPSADSPGTAPSAFESDAATDLALPSDDSDPVRSPDDPAAASATGQESGTSDSSTGLDQLLEPPPDTGKHRKKGEDDSIDAAFPHDGPKKDINIGEYYLESGNWQGALSRYESAMVQDPENPDAYWGMAEAQRHLGQYAQARANYLKVVDYDPDSKHGKDARKILKQPEIANAPAVSAGTSAAKSRQ